MALQLVERVEGFSQIETWIIRTPQEADKAVASLAALGVNFIRIHDHLSREASHAVADSAKEKDFLLSNFCNTVIKEVQGFIKKGEPYHHLQQPEPLVGTEQQQLQPFAPECRWAGGTGGLSNFFYPGWDNPSVPFP